MTTLEFSGRINDKGELEIETPIGFMAGTEVRVVITELSSDVDQDNQPTWTVEELRALLAPGDAKTGAEIAVWLNANPDTGGWAEVTTLPDKSGELLRLRMTRSSRLAPDGSIQADLSVLKAFQILRAGLPCTAAQLEVVKVRNRPRIVTALRLLSYADTAATQVSEYAANVSKSRKGKSAFTTRLKPGVPCA